MLDGLGANNTAALVATSSTPTVSPVSISAAVVSQGTFSIGALSGAT